MRAFLISTSAAALALIAAAPFAAAQDAPRVATATQERPAVDARPEFTFILFWREDNPATRAMNEQLRESLAKAPQRCQLAAVHVNDPAEQVVVDRYKVSRAPMPLVLCVAANEAVIGAIPEKATEEAIVRLMVPPTMTHCIKALQDGKLVLVHIASESDSTLPTGVAEFASDPDFQARTTILTVRRDDPAEARTLTDLEISSHDSGAVVALLAPPGVLVGKYDHNATRAQIAADLHAAGSCCSDPNCKHNRKGK